MRLHFCFNPRSHFRIRRSAAALLATLVALALSSPAFCGEIHDAARDGNLAKVKALLKDNPDLVFSKDGKGATPLHWAAAAGHKDMAELLLAIKAEVNAKANDGATPLHVAATTGHKDVAELLLANKANVNIKNNNGETALDAASRNGQKDVAELLRQHGGQAQDLNADLLKAVRNGESARVQDLLKQGADPNAREKNDRTALLIAAVEGYAPIVQDLLRAGASVNATSGPGMTALMAAASAGHTDVVELLLHLGADVNARAKGEVTALMMAATNGHASTVQSLVNAGADVNAKAEGGSTASTMAAHEGHFDVVQMLRQNAEKRTSENICLEFNKDEAWCSGSRQEDQRTTIVEFVKRGETIDNWSELVTVITAKNLANANLDRWLQVTEQQSKAGCSKGHGFEVKERAVIDGHPAVIYVERCEQLAKNPYSDKSVWGKPEASVHLDVAGSQNLYSIQRAARRPDLSEAMVNEWITFLKTARLCESLTAVPSCKE